MSRPYRPHLGPGHPLAAVAARHCERHSGRRGVGVGRVACGACWERAIRDDERIVVEYGLPRECSPDPADVDEVAVERACRGHRTRLTDAERVAAIRRLAQAGVAPSSIARRLHLADVLVTAVLDPSPIPAGPRTDTDPPGTRADTGTPATSTSRPSRLLGRAA